jgi:predicted metal-binding transcription factor (methanogenesis marker protein 9)
LVKQHDGQFPWEYLGCPLEEILDEMDMSVEQFVRICDRFTNKSYLFATKAAHL